MPAVPWPARPTACSTIDAMPWRSMSFIVNTCTRESRTATFSRSSRFRTPMITVCAGWTLGGAPPMPASSAGSGPRSAASGMPWTLPLCDVAGVFMSPCASIHSRPIGSCLRRLRPLGRGADGPGGEAVVAAQHERQGALRERRAGALVEHPAHVRDVADELLPLVRPLARFRNRRRQIALVDDGDAEAGEAIAEAGDAKRRRPHVHAAAVAAEVEGHADDVDRFHRSLTDTDIPSVPGRTIDVASAG